MAYEWQRAAFVVITDRRRLQIDTIHEFLRSSYWAAGVPMDVVQRSIENSIAFGAYEGVQQVGFARVISDCATFAYLSDVFILEPWRGQGLATWLVRCTGEHPDLQGLRRWMLATRDAHALYAQLGFVPLRSPERSSWSGTIPTPTRATARRHSPQRLTSILEPLRRNNDATTNHTGRCLYRQSLCRQSCGRLPAA